MNTSTYSSHKTVTTAGFMTQVYMWMTGALALTASIAFGISLIPNLQIFLARYEPIIGITVLVEIGLVIWLSARIHKMSFAKAAILFVTYAILNGITFSFIFLAYTASSVFATFLASSLTFGVMSVYGSVTRSDLSGIGNLAIMGVFGLFIGSIINIFLQSSTLGWIITFIGIGAFIILVAYDTQKLKQFAEEVDDQNMSKIAIIGALNLYLDFINLFLLLLRIFGERK